MAYEFNFKPEAFNVRINAKKDNMGGDILETLEWFNNTPQHHIRWMWYYKYRAALLQVKYPKDYIEFRQWKTEPKDKTDIQMKIYSLKNSIKTCRRMITRCNNGIENFVEKQNGMLIQDWNNKHYLKVLEKKNDYQEKLDIHLKELEKLES